MQHSHAYTYQHSTSSRSSSSHGTSSAFSANANPNEDWTKVSDLAERRRIQNRIAQRNYRKKLKRRLEDLERRAASSSTSPEQSHEELVRSKTARSSKSRTRSRESNESTAQATGHTSSKRFSPYHNYTAQDEPGTMFSHQCTRQLSASPPPALSYPSYSHLDPYGQPVYGQPTLYHPISGVYNDMSLQGEYAEPVPSIFPATASAEHLAKRIHTFTDGDMISPFNVSYATMAGIDLCSSSQPQPESTFPVVTLSPAYPCDQYDQLSQSTSPEASIFALPLTPESSDPCSPQAFPFL